MKPFEDLQSGSDGILAREKHRENVSDPGSVMNKLKANLVNSSSAISAATPKAASRKSGISITSWFTCPFFIFPKLDLES